MRISESVSLGHPDKIADYISERILDEHIKQDKNTKYALEVQVKDNFVSLAGEISTIAKVNFEEIVKKAVEEIGYDKEYQKKWGKENTICSDDLEIVKHISIQSPDIAQGLKGWGDQGIFIGCAVNSPETKFQFKDYYVATKLCKDLFDSKIGGLDIKTQVYVNDLNDIEKIIVAIPLLKDSDTKVVEDFVREKVPGDYILVVNGTGRYVRHSTFGDCGTTGRKLAVDFYGGNCEIGGGSPWTKDATKADLTLNVYARRLALKYVLQNNVKFAKCKIGCCIGKSDIDVTIVDMCNNTLDHYVIDKSPSSIIVELGLDKPVFAQLCRNGIFSL